MRRLLAVALIVAATACADGSRRPAIVEHPEWAEVFAASDVAGTFALHEVGSDEIGVFDIERAEQPYLPASTFKILNSLIILETGVLPDADTIVEWDGVDRGIDVWNRDHTLRTGIEVSAVWMFQELAREVGEARMADWVERVGYGNADTGGGIDQFWLTGDLRITALQQIEFLARVAQRTVPFTDDVVAAVRDILVREQGDDWSWSHKTGTSLHSDPDVGWLVGFTEYRGSEWVFALNLDLTVEHLTSELDPQVRQTIARRILEAAGALPHD